MDLFEINNIQICDFFLWCQQIFFFRLNFGNSPVTYGAIQIWTTLPSMIRNDPALASFRAQYEHIPSK